MVYRPECKTDTMKLLEENVGKTLFDINSSSIFLDSPPRVTEIKTKINKCVLIKRASQAVLVVKNPPVSARDLRGMGLIPGLGRSSGGGHGNLLQCSYLKNPIDRGAWQATVHSVSQSQTQLKPLSV